MIRLNGAAAERDFLARVVEASGQNLTACIQCGKCSGGCPITSAEVGGPRRLVAEILYGAKRQALEDPTWWYCVACGTCMTRCPVEINMYRVATALCEMAEHEGVEPSEPDIHLFEKLFVKSVERHGRANELRVVAGFNLRTRRPFKDLAQALTLARKGAITPGEMLRGSRADERTSRLFSRVQRKGTENDR
jgi:heterodisulfide reductase subunit C2